jgi:hypothetical protein
MAFLPVIGAMGSLGSISTVATIGASMLGAVGSIAQGQASQQAQQYNAKVAQIQATTAENQAASQSANIVDATRRKVGTAIAAGGESGIDTSEGSFRDLLANTSAFGHLDALTALYKGNVLATGYRNQAAADIYAGDQAALGGWMGAGTSLMRGVATAYKPGGSASLDI